MRLKIKSDGTGWGTTVCTEDGEPIDGVLSVVWEMATPQGLSTAVIRLRDVPADILFNAVRVPDEPLAAAEHVAGVDGS
jgi:hypothetical protein